MATPTRYGESALRHYRAASVLLLAAFCVVIAMITISPKPPDPDGQQALESFLAHGHVRGLPLWITFDKIEFGANILMFVPVGFFGALALGRARWVAVAMAVVASIAIEIVQAVRLPERVGTPKDVVANALGALIGYLLACVVVWAVRRRARERAERAMIVGTQRTEPLVAET